MKFLNSNYGYASFAKGTSRRAAPNQPFNSQQQSVTSGGTSRRTGGKEAPTAKTSTRGPLGKSVMGTEKRALVDDAIGPKPFIGPQQKRSKLKNVKDAFENKAQGYGAKGKNMLAKAGKFIKNNKVGVGLAAAGTLGAVGYGAYRKMRSDKGKKRGSNNN